MVTIPVKSRLCSVVVAGALAATVGCAGTAFAEEPAQPLDVTKYVSASNSPASQALPEILGLSGVDELQVDPYSTDVMTTYNTGAGLKYLLMGTTMYNVNPNPYFYNTVVAKSGTGVVYNKDHRWASMKKEISNPIRALAPFQSGDATDDAVWLLEPDVIIGNTITKAGALTDYSTSEYAPAVEKYLNQAEGTYKPIATEYTLNSMAEIVDKTYGVAECGEQVVSNSNGTKQLRYGSAEAIATNYEKYVKGTQGYILSQLEANKAQKKTVAVVEQQNEDGTYTITKTPSKWSTGTRFLEITTLVANNLADSFEGEEAATVTADQLSKADLIVLTTGASKADMGSLAKKTYWSTSNNNGAIYKVDANSVEIGTNYGRILGCLYPEYVDQSDMVAYYYDTFYHVKSDMLSDAVDKGMDGIRNWDIQDGNAGELLNWTADTVKDYSKAAVQAKLDAGIEWIYEQGEEADELLKLSSKHTFVDIDEAAVTLEATSYEFTDGGVYTPKVTSVKCGDATLVEGSDYTVSYADNDKVGTATVTVTGTGNYTGSATTTFEIAKKAEPISFKDVDPSAWYADAVSLCAEKGLIQGYPNGKFGVDDKASRVQMITILWRYANPGIDDGYDAATATYTGKMVDVEDGKWYTGAVEWAEKAGVISGVDRDGQRYLDGDITLDFQTMLTMIVNFTANEKDVEATALDALDRFVDGAGVSDWAQHTVAYAAVHGYFNGVDRADGRYIDAMDEVARVRVAGVLANCFETGVLE